MNTIPPMDLPAYHLGQDGAIWLNAAGQALLAQYKDIKARIAVLERSYCNAAVAALFLRNPWVGALTLTVSSDWEYDDCGNYFLSGSCCVDAVELVPSAVLPDDLEDDGQVDLDQVNALLSDELNDEAPEVAITLLGEDQAKELQIPFTREALLTRLNLIPVLDGTAPLMDRSGLP